MSLKVYSKSVMKMACALFAGAGASTESRCRCFGGDNVPVHVALRPEKIMLCEEPPLTVLTLR